MTGRRSTQESPRSPCSTRVRNRPYWTRRGRSSPNSRRSASACSADGAFAASIAVTSPGARYIMPKTTNVTPKSSRTIARSRLTTYPASPVKGGSCPGQDARDRAPSSRSTRAKDARRDDNDSGSRPEQPPKAEGRPLDAGKRRPEACAAHVEGRREPRTKGCDWYRSGPAHFFGASHTRVYAWVYHSSGWRTMPFTWVCMVVFRKDA